MHDNIAARCALVAFNDWFGHACSGCSTHECLMGSSAGRLHGRTYLPDQALQVAKLLPWGRKWSRSLSAIPYRLLWLPARGRFLRSTPNLRSACLDSCSRTISAWKSQLASRSGLNVLPELHHCTWVKRDEHLYQESTFASPWPKVLGSLRIICIVGQSWCYQSSTCLIFSLHLATWQASW